MLTGSSNPRKRGGGDLLGDGREWWGDRMGTSRYLEGVGEALVTLQRSCPDECFPSLRSGVKKVSIRRSLAENC